MRMTVYRYALLAVSIGLWAGCDTSQSARPGSASRAVNCSLSPVPGGSTFCREECPCDDGQGDCDDDTECLPGLECRSDIGAHFGWDPEVDVCVAQCSPLGKDIDDLCSPQCPCGDGVGDCDTDADCEPGGLCLKDVGLDYGYGDPDVDVCVIGCPTVGNGAGNYCSTTCPCDVGEGDCDDDDECAQGLQCADNVGADYGLDPDVDVCVPAECEDDNFEDNDTPDDDTDLGFATMQSSYARTNTTVAKLCSGDEDWYEVKSDDVSFDLVDIDILVRVMPGDYCPGCDGVSLPSAPENTITIELYSEDGAVLLKSWTSTKGLLKTGVSGDLSAYEDDFLIRVSGPPEAEYTYEFFVRLKGYYGEDECEC